MYLQSYYFPGLVDGQLYRTNGVFDKESLNIWEDVEDEKADKRRPSHRIFTRDWCNEKLKKKNRSCISSKHAFLVFEESVQTVTYQYAIVNKRIQFITCFDCV